jgi:hypothetical protein
VRILKFPLIGEIVRMPSGSRVLHVAMQRGRITLWALCPDSELVERRFVIYATGQSISPFDAEEYVGTILEADGDFVWHVFEGQQ